MGLIIIIKFVIKGTIWTKSVINNDNELIATDIPYAQTKNTKNKYKEQAIVKNDGSIL